MKALTRIVLFVVFIAATHAQAACGGGGFKPTPVDQGAPRSSTPTTATPGVRSTATTAMTPSAPAADLRYVVNTSFFDSVSTKLDLNEEQKKEISRIKYDIGDRISRLKSVQQKAQQRYLDCDGPCGNETRKLDEATRELQTFDADSEFAQRVSRILLPTQMDTYQRMIKEKRQS
jgi:hypothetical protein